MGAELLKQAYERALAEKESTIKRLAEQERGWRAYFFKQKGLSQQEVELLLTAGAEENVPAKTKKPRKSSKGRK